MDFNKIFPFFFHYSNKDVSAKDIVSGIISAANRKMLRAATGSHQGKSSSSNSGSASGNKKDSVDKSSSETSKSTQKLDTIDSSNKHHSRRNSESVIFCKSDIVEIYFTRIYMNLGSSTLAQWLVYWYSNRKIRV